MTISRNEAAAFADARETSVEIAQAILEHAAADRIWSSPTASEMDEITARAWELADNDVQVLHWGQEEIYRAP